MPTEEETHSAGKIISDQASTKKRKRGRPAHIEPSVVVGSADIYCLWFKQYWSKLGPRLLAARSAEDIKQAIAEHAPGIIGNLAPRNLRGGKKPSAARHRSAGILHRVLLRL
jgi:hypothetical protein